MKKIIVPKEKAVFRLDKNGRWYNEHGPFEHQKVIDYFHSSIRKDDVGYHVFQASDEFEEKVYFHYDDTALFVFDILIGDEIIGILNTKKQLQIATKHLFIRQDNLYVRIGDEIAKFTSQCLIKLSKHLVHDGERCFIKTKDGMVEITQE